MLKILQGRLKQYVDRELPEVQAGFRRGRGTRDQIANMRWIMEKAREFQKDIYFCFIDYAKAFDCVDHSKLWQVLKEMGVPDHLICLLRNLYVGQEATVRTGYGTIWIWKGVRQGCILSPCLFNLYAEFIMRKAGLDESLARIKIAGRNINNLRYADDTTLMAESEEELKNLLMRVKEESAKICFEAQHQKNEDHGHWSHHLLANRRGRNGGSERFYFLGLHFFISRGVDLACVMETWVREGATVTLREMAPSGFSVLHQSRTVGRGGGVALLIREDCPFRALPSPSIPGIECVGLVWGSEESLAVWLVYRPPSAPAATLSGLLEAVAGWALEFPNPVFPKLFWATAHLFTEKKSHGTPPLKPRPVTSARSVTPGGTHESESFFPPPCRGTSKLWGWEEAAERGTEGRRQLRRRRLLWWWRR
uniref:Reverse transcriptase domain-containing protein n=1 Tax=Podarcis muralis TaxID=64176 RepID=A0A670K1W5_PODMU